MKANIVPVINAVVVIATGLNALEEGRLFGYVYFVCAAIYLLIVALTIRKYIQGAYFRYCRITFNHIGGGRFLFTRKEGASHRVSYWSHFEFIPAGLGA